MAYNIQTVLSELHVRECVLPSRQLYGADLVITQWYKWRDPLTEILGMDSVSQS